MIPSPPAFETADASCDRAMNPIGAWTIGSSTPSSRVTLLSKRIRESLRKRLRDANMPVSQTSDEGAPRMRLGMTAGYSGAAMGSTCP